MQHLFTCYINRYRYKTCKTCILQNVTKFFSLNNAHQDRPCGQDISHELKGYPSTSEKHIKWKVRLSMSTLEGTLCVSDLVAIFDVFGMRVGYLACANPVTTIYGVD